MALDIMADLAASARPVGVPCRIAVMRRDRPELAEQWDRVVAAKTARAVDYSNQAIADWFTAQGFKVTRNLVERHTSPSGTCSWCSAGLVA